jgi:hypothetical protein
MKKILLTFVPGLIGGAVGGYLGSLIFKWIWNQGLYAPVIPGALAGLLCGFCSINNSKIRGVLCSLIALMSGLLTEWKYTNPPVKTDSFVDFVAHFHEQIPLTLILVGLGTFLGFWWGRETTFPWRHRFVKPIDEV